MPTEDTHTKEATGLGHLQVQWDATDAFPRYLAYFMRYVIGTDKHQAMLFEDWNENDRLSQEIIPNMEDGYVISFDATDKYYKTKGINKPQPKVGKSYALHP